VTRERRPEGRHPNPTPDQRNPSQSSGYQCRARASGDEAVNLLEAAIKIDAVASVLAHIAVDNTNADELLLPVVKMLDSALRLVERS
jgi:hypothetical protein